MYNVCDFYKMTKEFYYNYNKQEDFRDFCKVHRIMYKNSRGELVANSKDIKRIVGYWLKKNRPWYSI